MMSVRATAVAAVGSAYILMLLHCARAAPSLTPILWLAIYGSVSRPFGPPPPPITLTFYLTYDFMSHIVYL